MEEPSDGEPRIQTFNRGQDVQQDVGLCALRLIHQQRVIAGERPRPPVVRHDKSDLE